MDRTEVIERLEPLRQRRPIAIEHTPRTRVVLDGERAAIRRGSGTPLAFSEAGRARLHAFIGVTPRTMERGVGTYSNERYSLSACTSISRVMPPQARRDRSSEANARLVPWRV